MVGGWAACRCKKTNAQFYQSSSLTNAMMLWRTGGTSTELDPMVGGWSACRCKKTKSQFYQSLSLTNAMMVWRTGGTSTELNPMGEAFNGPNTDGYQQGPINYVWARS